MDAILEKIANLTNELAALESVNSTISINAETAQMNSDRLENTDHTFGKLCIYMDRIFDTDPPFFGGNERDCCYQSFTGTEGSVGGLFLCEKTSFLELMIQTEDDYPYNLTDTGVCATTCGRLASELSVDSFTPTRGAKSIHIPSVIRSLNVSNNPVEEAIEKLCNISQALADLKTSIENNSANALENQKRNENINYNFEKLCPLIDRIFDSEDGSSAIPGGYKLDCCFSSFTGDRTADSIGQSMECTDEGFLTSPWFTPPFAATDTGTCASSCSSLPPKLEGASLSSETVDKKSLLLQELSDDFKLLRSVIETVTPTIDSINDTICSLAERLETLKANVSSNAETIEMNRKRHENADLTFTKLCPLIDQIYDTTSAPGGVHYDCCKAEYTGDASSTGSIGGGMTCLSNSYLTSPFFTAPYPVSAQGSCADTCASLPPALEKEAEKMAQAEHEAFVQEHNKMKENI